MVCVSPFSTGKKNGTEYLFMYVIKKFCTTFINCKINIKNWAMESCWNGCEKARNSIQFIYVEKTLRASLLLPMKNYVSLNICPTLNQETLCVLLVLAVKEIMSINTFPIFTNTFEILLSPVKKIMTEFFTTPETFCINSTHCWLFNNQWKS